MIALAASRCRWLEPFGQLIVLAAIALQLFSVNPAVEASGQASTAYTQALQQELLLQSQDKSGHAQSDLSLQKDQVALKEKQEDAADKKKEADAEKARSAGIYKTLFIFGTFLAIVGKLASVAYGTKSSPSPSGGTPLPLKTDAAPIAAGSETGASAPAGV